MRSAPIRRASRRRCATAASTFRPNPKFETEKAITELGKGEALVSVLDPKGVPTMVERTLIRPPSGQLGPITPEQRAAALKASPVSGIYDEAVDKESAYEKLAKKAAASTEARQQAAEDKAAAKAERAERPAGRQRESATDRFVKNVAGSVGRQVGNAVVRNVGGALVRGILGSLFRR